MQEYRPYLRKLEKLLSSAQELSRNDKNLLQALSSGPAEELRRTVPIAIRRSNGIFFTGRKLARRLCTLADIRSAGSDLVFDPACGAGDLLLEIARRFVPAENRVHRAE